MSGLLLGTAIPFGIFIAENVSAYQFVQRTVREATEAGADRQQITDYLDSYSQPRKLYIGAATISSLDAYA